MFLPNHANTKDTKAMISECQEDLELLQGVVDYFSFISTCRSWCADCMKKLCENLTVEDFVISALWVCWLCLICISI